MRPLLIGRHEKLAIDRIKTLAELAIVDVLALMKNIETVDGKAAHMAQMRNQTIPLPVGYLVTFSIEDGHGAGRCFHLSVSVDNPKKLPSPEAVWMIAEAYGFYGSLRDTVHWIETLKQGRAINVVQPLTVIQARGSDRPS